MSKLRPLKIPYGLKDGRLVHVSEVESGKACGCLSPLDERTALVARKGEKKREHFAAKAMCDPVVARETIFHRLAKQVLSDERSLLLPSIKLRLENRILALRPNHMLRNVEVQEEHQIEDSPFVAASIMILDLKGTKKRLVVEWVVTHACEQQKVDYLRLRRVPSI